MSQFRFIVGQQVVPALINAGLNGAIAWAQHAKTPVLGLWDNNAYAIDLLATGFLLPAISWLILRPLLRSQQAKGKAPSLVGCHVPRLLPWMSSSLWRGSLTAGLIGMLAVGCTAVIAAMALGSPEFTGQHYAWLKAGYAGVLTVVMQPLMVFAALRGGPNEALARPGL